MARWWEKETMRFECQSDCFKCCLKPGVIYFDDEDVAAVTDHLGCRPADFKKEYLKKEDGVWELSVEDDAPCPFLSMQGCMIHPVKPKQCRTYPFWNENLRTRNHWKLTAGFCPGINEGPKIDPKAIHQALEDFDL